MILNQHIAEFVKAVAGGEVEIYNEFSLQHELGLFLRSKLNDCKVQFERNVSHFNLLKSDLYKRELAAQRTARRRRIPQYTKVAAAKGEA